MEHLYSKDGTAIAYERGGKGLPLVLVHGTGIDHTYWDPVVPGLERHFCVYRLDRRGRGRSGDAATYSIQMEFEDVAAMVESIPGQVFLLGHSYGALCSLESALLTADVSMMVLNEPPMYTTVELSYEVDAAERFVAYFAASDLERALLELYEATGVSAAEVETLRALPNWEARVKAVPTIPREILSVRNYSFEPGRFKDMKTPVLLLAGRESMPVYTAAIDVLQSSLPRSRRVVLPGQKHDPVITAPDTFLREVLRFLGVRDTG